MDTRRVTLKLHYLGNYCSVHVHIVYYSFISLCSHRQEKVRKCKKGGSHFKEAASKQ